MVSPACSTPVAFNPTAAQVTKVAPAAATISQNPPSGRDLGLHG
ncbi:MAG: hypothetical protein VKK32_08105 [Candidatus Melainabacteria bacterium]|nr:hypothetical protein [Candidatus Melainabacteria bacterium]